MVKRSSVKIFFLFILICFLCLPGIAQKYVNSNWVTNAINVDGNMADWGNDTLSSEKKFGVEYALKNDGEYLFVLFVLTDQQYFSSVNLSGVTIYLDPTEKKKKDYSINFRLVRVPADNYIMLLEQRGRTLTDDDKARIRTNPFYMLNDNKVLNKKGDPLPLPEGIDYKVAAFKVMNQQNVLIFEFAIPLARVTEAAPGVGVEPGKTFKIGFEWGGMTKQMKEDQLKRMGDSSARAQDTRAGGLSAERGASSRLSSEIGMARMRKMSPKKYSFWKDIKLAAVQEEEK